MCLAIPGKILSIEGEADDLARTGKVSFGGVVKTINLGYAPEAKLDDYVIVHAGVAISVVDEEEALKTIADIKEIEKLNRRTSQPED